MIASYSLDETSGSVVVDSTGNHNGVNYSLTIGVAGKVDTAYQSSADSQYATLLPTNVLTPSADAIFSFDAWLFPTAISANTLQGRAITLRGLNNASNFIVGVDATNKLYLYDGAARVETSATVNVNEWLHIAVVRNGTETLIYANGNLVLTHVHTLKYQSDDFVYIGIPSPTNMKGKYDEVNFWDRELTQEEITNRAV